MLSHILVCFLGYVLWNALAQWMRRAGFGNAPRTLLEEFAKIKSGDVGLTLPLRLRQIAPGKRWTTPRDKSKMPPMGFPDLDDGIRYFDSQAMSTIRVCVLGIAFE